MLKIESEMFDLVMSDKKNLIESYLGTTYI